MDEGDAAAHVAVRVGVLVGLPPMCRPPRVGNPEVVPGVPLALCPQEWAGRAHRCGTSLSGCVRALVCGGGGAGDPKVIARTFVLNSSIESAEFPRDAYFVVEIFPSASRVASPAES